jgi:hypothetical protein
MPFYLGNPGAVAQLPLPIRPISPPLIIPYAVAATIGGGQVAMRAPGPGRRTFTLVFDWLDAAALSVFEEFFTGARGPGPFALLDPGRVNRLTANQSSATSVSNDGSGFSVAPGSGEAVTSNAATYLRGPRSARWSLPGTVLAGVLDFDPPTGLAGLPAPTGQPWTFSGQLSCAGLAASVTVTPAVSWRRVDGSEVSTTAGTPVAAVVGSWTAYSVSAAGPPAGAVAVRAQLRVTPGVLVSGAAGVGMVGTVVGRRTWAGAAGTGGPSDVIASGRPVTPAPGWATFGRGLVQTTDVLVDQPMLDMFGSVRTWALGTGVPRCSLVAMPETNRVIPYRDLVVTLVEVG